MIDVHPTVMEYRYGGIPKRLGIPELKKNDAISIIGVKGLTVANYVKNTYNSVLSSTFFEADIRTDPIVTNPRNFERGDKWGARMISMVKTGTLTLDVQKDFKCSGDKNKLVSFLIFHAGGHNAGIYHIEPSLNNDMRQAIRMSDPTREGFGFMSDGNGILGLLGKNTYNDLLIFNSLEELINYTEYKYPIICNEIKIRYEN